MKNLIYIILIVLFMSSCSSKESKTANSLVLKDRVEEDHRQSTNLEKRLNYLESIIDEPLDGDSRITKLMETNAEWILFTYSFTTFSLYHLYEKDLISYERCIELMLKAINKYLDPGVSMHYGTDPYKLEGYTSVLYLGHLNMMLGCYRKIAKNDRFLNLHETISLHLEKRFTSSPYFQLPSYPEAIWISDNAQAMASLKLFDEVSPGKIKPVWKKWIKQIEEKYTDPHVNLPYSTINFDSGKPEEEPRGSMLGWIIFFEYYFDSKLAKTHYENYKEYFSADSLGFRMFRERYNDFSTNIGDIDSGPIINGFSIPASQFAFIDAILVGDQETVNYIEKLVRFGTEEIETEEQFHYKTRMIDFEISPLAEALMLYALSRK